MSKMPLNSPALSLKRIQISCSKLDELLYRRKIGINSSLCS
ncbi:hypothetical protein [Oceanobacillus indicireducens]|nr:hypothetical protein [Oceanobacillus indicireducens]